MDSDAAAGEQSVGEDKLVMGQLLVAVFDGSVLISIRGAFAGVPYCSSSRELLLKSKKLGGFDLLDLKCKPQPWALILQLILWASLSIRPCLELCVSK
eukprot:scaffold38862_cov13-Tisochrysis_lutea.AAC.1